MNFDLSEEQQRIQSMVREFAEKEIRPIAAEIDREHRFPAENIQRMAQLGMLGITVPKEYEGSGGDYVSYSLTMEELARVDATHAAMVSGHLSLCIHPILAAGTE